MSKLAVVVVHHDSVATIGSTISSIVASGVDADRIRVVDNSEQESVATALRAVVDERVDVHQTSNAGYATAVNFGVSTLGEQDLDGLVLVCTHEVIFDEGAIEALVDVLDADPTVLCAGPTLVTGTTHSPTLWSTGGRLSAVLRRPAHHFDQDVVAPVGGRVGRDWLDGAAVVYRARFVRDHPLPEDYFLYMEEVDYHCQIRESGAVVAWVPAARAWQSSHGVPPYYFARNIQIFQARWGRPRWARLAASYLVLGRAVRLVLSRDRDGLTQLGHGWSAGRTAWRTR